MVFVLKWPFFNLYFWGNICQENVFYDILARKNGCLGYKKKKLKELKNWHFSKGVNPWFWYKNSHFFKLFFWGNIGQENVFYDILDRKNAFLCYKNKKLKKSKNWHFFKGVIHGFGSKMAIFEPFLLKQYRQGKCLLRYSRRKKRLPWL